ncbi:MAG: hypothetical protein R6V03_03960 [Kiritimatiellia bacterium]
MILVLIKIAVILGLLFGTGYLTDRLGIESMVPGILAFWGGVCFFLGPHATGSGFFVKGGFYVNAATPEWIWRIAGFIMWIIGGVVLVNLARAA